jgi:hypothetical protein
VFEHGVVRKTFLIAINNDNEPELDETFQLVLSEPTDGSSLGNQFITQVTILDDEKHVASRINHWNSSVFVDSISYPAGESAHFDVITRNYNGYIVAADSGESITIQVINRVRSVCVVYAIVSCKQSHGWVWMLQPSRWNVELGYEAGDGIRDFMDGQDGSLAQFDGNSVGYPVTGIVNGLVTDLPVLDGR